MISNPDSLRFNDPETGLNSLRRESADRTIEALQACPYRLIRRPKHDNAWRTGRIVPTRIGKIAIERDEDSRLALTRRLHRRIVDARELFLKHVVDIPAMLGEARACSAGQILVELETHGLRRNGHDTFVCKRSGVSDCRGNMRGFQRRVLLQDRLRTFASREIVEDDVHRNARASHAGRAMHAVGVDPDVSAPIHAVLPSGHAEYNKEVFRMQNLN
jgi:hypothetical protein